MTHQLPSHTLLASSSLSAHGAIGGVLLVLIIVFLVVYEKRIKSKKHPPKKAPEKKRATSAGVTAGVARATMQDLLPPPPQVMEGPAGPSDSPYGAPLSDPFSAFGSSAGPPLLPPVDLRSDETRAPQPSFGGPPAAPETPRMPPAAPQQVAAPAPGWYKDPNQPGMLRYWDGKQWTSHVARPA